MSNLYEKSVEYSGTFSNLTVLKCDRTYYKGNSLKLRYVEVCSLKNCLKREKLSLFVTILMIFTTEALWHGSCSHFYVLHLKLSSSVKLCCVRLLILLNLITVE